MTFEKDLRSVSAEVLDATEQKHIDKISSRLKDIEFLYYDQLSRVEATKVKFEEQLAATASRLKDIEIYAEDLASRLKDAKGIIEEQYSEIQSLQNKLHKLHMESLQAPAT